MRRSSKKGEPLDRVLHYESQPIPYRLHLGKRRSLRISVTPDLVVNVFAPARASAEWLEDALLDRAGWIVKTLKKVAKCEILSVPQRPVTGTVVKFLGRDYRLTLIKQRRTPPELFFDSLLIALSDPEDTDAARRALIRWYRDQARAIFDQSIRRCLPTVRSFGVKQPVVSVRNMRSRWGSCSATGRVNLNLKLVMVAPDLIDYVVMHELCHMVHHDHSRRFYALLNRCMPDWKRRKEALDGYRMK